MCGSQIRAGLSIEELRQLQPPSYVPCVSPAFRQAPSQSAGQPQLPTKYLASTAWHQAALQRVLCWRCELLLPSRQPKQRQSLTQLPASRVWPGKVWPVKCPPAPTRRPRDDSFMKRQDGQAADMGALIAQRCFAAELFSRGAETLLQATACLVQYRMISARLRPSFSPCQGLLYNKRAL